MSPSLAWSAWNAMRASSGPFLEITVEDVHASRSRAPLGYLESAMLFPDDADKRCRCIHATAAEAMVDEMPEILLATKAAARSLRNAPPLPDFDLEMKRRFTLGAIIGAVLLAMINNENLTLGQAFKKAEKTFSGREGQIHEKLAINSIQKNWWPRLRSVAHLWASSLCRHNSGQPMNLAFPCSREDFPDFLAAAEYLRYLGECRALHRQGRTTLLGDASPIAVSRTILLPFPTIGIEGRRELWQNGPTAE
jgi:hypothetical protein